MVVMPFVLIQQHVHSQHYDLVDCGINRSISYELFSNDGGKMRIAWGH